jgi:acyl carrier protein
VNEHETAARVHAILRKRNAHVELTPELPLGGNGLGLDSISLVEVLLDCELEFGVNIAAELLAEPSITVGALIASIQSLKGE